jgi:signal transduction histidine kinase
MATALSPLVRPPLRPLDSRVHGRENGIPPSDGGLSRLHDTSAAEVGSRMSWRLPSKPHAPAVVVLLALLASTIAAVAYTHRLQSLTASIVAENVAGLQAASELEFALRDIRGVLYRYAASYDERTSSGDETLLGQLTDIDAAFRATLDSAWQAATTDEARRHLHVLTADYDHYAPAIRELSLTLPIAEDESRAKRAADELIAVLSDRLLPLCHDFLEAHQASITENAEAHAAVTRRLQFVLILAGFLVPVAGVGVGFLASRSLSQQLDRSQQELLRAEQLAAVGRLAAGMAHELRNPLTSIMMMVQTATPDEPADFDVIEDEVRRMERTIQACLDFAKPPEPHRGPLDVRDVVRDACRLVEGRLRRQQIELVLEQADEPLVVLADANQLHQVFLNLLLNAIESVGTRGRIGTISRAEGSEVVIAIWDQGPGIPTDILPAMFEPFVSSKATGTGLGLSISKRIIEGHGGRIEGRNRPEGGAEIMVRLLRQQTSDNREGAYENAAGRGRRAEHPTRVSPGIPA